MPRRVFKKIRKRSGRLHKFDVAKIENAIGSAGRVTGEIDNKIAKRLTIKVVRLAYQMVEDGETPNVEDLQDIVEEVLLSSTYHKTAKEYILYRDQKERVREMSSSFNVNLINKYLDRKDWKINENSNMDFSLSGLNNYMSSELSKTYWLNEIYPKEIRNAHMNGDIHIHDLNAISVYCFSGDTRVSMVNGDNPTFKELVEKYSDKEFWIYSIDENKQIVPGLARNPRVTRKDVDLIKITLDNDKDIKCTLDHQFMLRTGEYKQAQDLVEGDSLMPLSVYRRGSDYRVVYNPRTNDKRYIHRLFTEAKDGEVVHHKNGIKYDNRPCNLGKMKDKVHRSMEIKKTMKSNLWKDKHRETMVAFNKSESKREQVRELALSRPERDKRGHFVAIQNHKVKCVQMLNEKQDVYDLTVDKYHNFGLEAGVFVHNCVGWDLYDLLITGFTGVAGKVESSPAKHFRVALGQIVNFVYTLQNECSGAQAFSNIDTLLAPFIRHDKLTYKDVKQSMQEFIFNMNVSTRHGGQTPFSNLTFDLEPSSIYKDQSVIIGGEVQEEKYGDFQKEMDWFNKAFFEVMLEGDAKNRVFTFPIPTYNITSDFDWDNNNIDLLWSLTAKYGIPYFSNFINSSMKPEDSRSMCCRLRLDVKQLEMRGGGLFGARPLVGSIGVVTINMPKLAFNSATGKDFMKNLGSLMDQAKESLEIKRDVLEKFTKADLYPYAKFYLRNIEKRFHKYWVNHFSTIGLIGMNEACLNLLGVDIATSKGKKFAEKVLDFMRKRLLKYQEQTGNNYNLEATPAEGTSYRLAIKDKSHNKDIICANEEQYKLGAEPFYSNSTQLPVGLTDDMFEALDLQDSLQTKYTGGCIEKGNYVITDKGVLKIEDIVENYEELKPIKAVSFNSSNHNDEWDTIIDAMAIDVSKKDKIRIRAERGLDITTSDWHPFYVLDGENAVEKRADELTINDYILQNRGCLQPFEDSNLDYEDAFLLGYFIGDGCFSKYTDNRGGNNIEKTKIRFFDSSMRTMEYVRDTINRKFDCNINVIKNDIRSDKLLEISSSKDSLSDFFLKYGYKPGNKTYNVSITSEVKGEIVVSNFYGFLSGLIASDGHIDKHGDMEYCTVSEQLAIDIVHVCTINGMMCGYVEKKSVRENEHTLYRVRIPSYELTRYKDVLCIFEKKNNIKEKISNKKKRHLPVVRVKSVSKVDVNDNMFYDLTTEKNHNYLAGKNTFVYIHNTVMHLFIGEKIDDTEALKRLVKKICENYHMPYFTISPTFSICPKHGYMAGEHKFCPKCDAEIQDELEEKQ